jgi:hypothetical protein
MWCNKEVLTAEVNVTSRTTDRKTEADANTLRSARMQARLAVPTLKMELWLWTSLRRLQFFDGRSHTTERKRSESLPPAWT